MKVWWHEGCFTNVRRYMRDSELDNMTDLDDCLSDAKTLENDTYIIMIYVSCKIFA